MGRARRGAGRIPAGRGSPLLTAFAVSPPGFEDLVEEELREAGLACRRTEGGVEFRGGWRDVYRANLWSRVASRVLVRVADFEAESFGALERGLRGVSWGDWLPRGAPVVVKAAKHASRLYHTGKIARVALEVLSGAASAMAAASSDEGVGVYLRLLGPRVTVSLDTSGSHLHRRGYRVAPGPAPLRENLAAGLLRRARWDGREPLLDPLCGAGTLAIEAALRALRIPPGLNRSFAFESFPSCDANVWAEIRMQALSGALPALPAPVYAADQEAEAVELVVKCARRAGLSDHLQVAVSAVEGLEPPGPAGCIVTNPPYGKRLGGGARAYRALGGALRGSFGGWRWAVVVPEPERERGLGVAVKERHPFRSGGLRLWLATGGPEVLQ